MKRRRKPLPRPKTLPEFFEREEQFWQELLASWEGLPEEAFFQPGACGPEWTIKDTMNHILVWQEAALRILPMLARERKRRWAWAPRGLTPRSISGTKMFLLTRPCAILWQRAGNFWT